MTQIILDPSNTSSSAGAISVPTLPPKARKFGFLPNTRLCLPGDVILYASVAPNALGKAIAQSQVNGGFGADHARWTHAAVFLFDDLVVEAVPYSGVVTRTIYNDVPGKLIRVRRDLSLSEAERYRIALRALRKIGSAYSHGRILSLWRQLRGGLWDRNNDNPTSLEIVICSKLFSDAYAEEKRSFLAGCDPGTPATPAHLSQTADLEDQHIGWLKLTT